MKLALIKYMIVIIRVIFDISSVDMRHNRKTCGSNLSAKLQGFGSFVITGLSRNVQ